ncbi:hypothetical protein [Pontivivens ytuae]|uniref:Uncharacterized protein n=1 Tax=Pontivivens ytuae TaxID=2789856 RepID=A0A7S9QBQ5_9RHOB|nr:hypothetical protein [Pontivivens ytuae]QPH53138.1 hypothetical protein I0K15_15210 [Pontivivens ytuae]
MRIIALALLLAGILQAGAAAALGLQPMRAEGATPGGAKAFYINVLNPFDYAVQYELTLLEPDLQTPAGRAAISRSLLTVPPGRSQRVVLTFDIDEASDERTVRLCAFDPSNVGDVLVRVCGTYTGYRFGSERHRRALSPQSAQRTGGQ